MANQTTDRMIAAVKMIKRGMSPARAAEAAGVKRQSIYASAVYKKMKADKAAKEVK